MKEVSLNQANRRDEILGVFDAYSDATLGAPETLLDLAARFVQAGICPISVDAQGRA